MSAPLDPAMNPAELLGIDLVVFDKDGTLIDFDAMWGGWAEDLAERLEVLLGRPIRDELHRTIGYDTAARRTIPGSPLAATPMAQLRIMTTDLVIESTGATRAEAEGIVEAAWAPPDPVSLAHPLADLDALFGGLRSSRQPDRDRDLGRPRPDRGDPGRPRDRPARRCGRVCGRWAPLEARSGHDPGGLPASSGSSRAGRR